MKSKLLETQIRRHPWVAAFSDERAADGSICLVSTGVRAVAGWPQLQAQKGRGELLLVSDDVGLGARLGSVIDRKELAFTQVNDSAGAFRLADRDRPAVVLLDLDLPAVAGWDAAEQFLDDEDGSSLVLMTGRTDHFCLSAAIQAGTIMDKSVSPARLLESVDRVLMETEPELEDRRVRQRRLIRWLRPYTWTVTGAADNRHWGINE